ncbi:TadE/TadG family type IV pilus assembly protein, partial [Allisonella histaminiformans]
MKQRGQTLVEFALLLPLFVLFLFGTMYVGFLFSDYMSYDNMAR